MKYKLWLKIWLDYYVKPTVKIRTFNSYCKIVELHIVEELGELELARITSQILQQYVSALLLECNLKTGKALSSNTVNEIIMVINSSLKTAKEFGYAKAIIAKVKRPKTVEKKVTSFSFNEQKKIERAILDGKNIKLFGIVICLYTGLRIGELLALEWSAVDFKKREMTISKTCYDGLDGDGIFRRITTSPKTQNSERVIPIPQCLIPLFMELKSHKVDDFVIYGRQNPLTMRSYQRSFQTLLSKLHISQKGFHALRHTFATRAIESGMDIKTLSEILGHKNATITLNRYAHSMTEYKKSAMNKLGRML